MPILTSSDRVAPEMRREENAVRQGVTLGVMRWVLGISLALVVVAMGLAYVAM